jgi:hypothetical protein
MLGFLRGRASDRKLRLFACACCRRIWHLLADERSRRAVEVAERFADRQATTADLDAARAAAEVSASGSANDAFAAAWRAVHEAAGDAARCAGRSTARAAARGVRWGPAWDNARDDAATAQCDVLRDLFGNPFRPVPVSPEWLTWDAAAVVRLAQAAYDERHLPAGTLDNDRLAVLADALEEADCQDGQILGHLRSGGDHVRGCWALDLVLGKS